MATNNLYQSDLPKLHHIVQNTMISHPKEIIIATLRDFFQHDSYYHYSKDPWGFPNTVDQTDLPLDAGMNDEVSTRLYIGENYRFNGIFYPAILVKHGGSKSVPISFNREDSTVVWDLRAFDDGYGNVTYFKNPKSFVFAGAWEGSIIIDVMTRSLSARDDLVELVGLCFTDITFKSLQKAGIVCKSGSPTIGSPSEIDDRNDKLFRQTLTLDVRTEWRREIPISNVVEAISFSVDFGYLKDPNAPVASNLAITTTTTVADIMGS